MPREGIAGPDDPQEVGELPSIKALVTPIPEPQVTPGDPAVAPSARGPGGVSVAAPVAAKGDRPATPSARVVEPKRPYHVGVALGVAAGLYAGSLAAVTRLQIDHDQALIVDRQPVRDAIELLDQHHDAMDDDLSVAAGAYDAAAGSYNQLALELVDVHRDVATVAKQLRTIRRLAVVDGSGLGSLPRLGTPGGSVPAPAKAASRTSHKSDPPPPVVTHTGASGGG
jgi:hypothetical protein